MLARDTAVSEARAKGSSDRMIYRISRECEMWWGKVSLKWRVFEFGLNRVWWTRKLILSMRSELSPTVLSFRCMRSRDSRPCANIRRLSTNYSRRKVISVCRIWFSSASWEEWLTLERIRGIGRKVEIDLVEIVIWSYGIEQTLEWSCGFPGDTKVIKMPRKEPCDCCRAEKRSRDGGCFWAELEARDTMRQVLFSW